MRKTILFLCAATVMCGCGGGTAGGGLETLDLEAAIGNRRNFDLSEIAKSIELVALDDSEREGLLGDILGAVQTEERFYIQDNGREFPLKVFDRGGRFLSTLGRYGRGPDEFAGGVVFAVDPDIAVIYMAGRMGDGTEAVVAYDAAGGQILRGDSIPGGRLAFFDGRLIVMRSSPAPFSFGGDPDFVPSIGTKVPLLEVYSADLRHERTIEVVDKGDGSIIMIEGSGNLADPSNIRSVSVRRGPAGVLSAGGNSLLVKEPLGDTVYHYRDGALEAAFRLAAGRYTPPAGAFGLNPAVPLGDSYAVHNVWEGGRYVFVAAIGAKDGVGAVLVLDRENPSAGFSATGGAEGKPGLFLDGLAFAPLYVRDGRLAGYLSALDVADNVRVLTNPDLKALAATLREDSNPVLAIVELK
jgi:hypothetical protein